jgi:hypothetical protein
MNSGTDNLKSTVLPNRRLAFKGYRIAVGAEELRLETPK